MDECLLIRCRYMTLISLHRVQYRVSFLFHTVLCCLASFTLQCVTCMRIELMWTFVPRDSVLVSSPSPPFPFTPPVFPVCFFLCWLALLDVDYVNSNRRLFFSSDVYVMHTRCASFDMHSHGFAFDTILLTTKR